MSKSVTRQIEYLALSIVLGFVAALVGGGWIIFAPVINPKLLKPNTTVYDLAPAFLLLWLGGTGVIRSLIYFLGTSNHPEDRQ